MKNYYGSLCTEMYEILHKDAPRDEFSFYLSYAEKDMSILEPLCGSGRFFIPFLKRGYDIQGIDLSNEMLSELKVKEPNANVIQGDILNYNLDKKFDYIFITSGSVSLFTDMEICKLILKKMKSLLKKGGRFVFAVDTIANSSTNDADYKVSVSVKTKKGYDLVLKNKNYYDKDTQTQFSPSIYELYNGTVRLQQETMDFQTHLYKPGEMEDILYSVGFTEIKVYSSYDKGTERNNQAEMFLYECTF